MRGVYEPDDPDEGIATRDAMAPFFTERERGRLMVIGFRQMILFTAIAAVMLGRLGWVIGSSYGTMQGLIVATAISAAFAVPMAHSLQLLRRVVYPDRVSRWETFKDTRRGRKALRQLAELERKLR